MVIKDRSALLSYIGSNAPKGEDEEDDTNGKEPVEIMHLSHDPGDALENGSSSDAERCGFVPWTCS